MIEEFYVNDFLTITNMEIGTENFEFMKHGQLEPYSKFTGFIDNKKVEGFVCLKDDNIYKLKYLEE